MDKKNRSTAIAKAMLDGFKEGKKSVMISKTKYKQDADQHTSRHTETTLR